MCMVFKSIPSNTSSSLGEKAEPPVWTSPRFQGLRGSMRQLECSDKCQLRPGEEAGWVENEHRPDKGVTHHPDTRFHAAGILVEKSHIVRLW